MSQHEYSGQRQALIACRDEGFGFGEALAVLDQLPFEDKKFRIKAAQRPPRVYHGVELINVPHMGQYTEVPAEMAAAFRRAVICGHLRQFITPETSAVVELGCGAGEIIVSLARDNTRLPTRFIGTEIAPDSLACVDLLTDMAQVSNVDAVQLDIGAPNLDFLRADENVLFLTCSVFAATQEGDTARFLRAMANRLKKARVCAFEPIAWQLADVFPDHEPLFVADWERQGFCKTVWTEIKDVVDEKTLKIERIIPDMTGVIFSNTLSLIQVATPEA